MAAQSRAYAFGLGFHHRPASSPVEPLPVASPATKTRVETTDLPLSGDSAHYSSSRDLNQGEKAYKSTWFNFPLLLANAGSDILWRLLFAKKIHLYLNENTGDVPRFQTGLFRTVFHHPCRAEVSVQPVTDAILLISIS